MATPTLPDRRTPTSRPARRQQPQVPYRGLFLEPDWPAQADTDEDDED